MSLIEIKKKLLMAQKSGLDVSEVFNTSLWTGTGAVRTITTGIDSSEGSLVWIKNRGATQSHVLADTERGTSSLLASDLASPQLVNSTFVRSFLIDGYELGANIRINAAGNDYVGWQFRRAEKFFDIVQYTGDGTAGRSINHNLGVTPGLLVVKRWIGADSNWVVQHVSTGTQYGSLNEASAFSASNPVFWPSVATDSSFSVGTTAALNTSGNSYIAYLFAHDPSPEGIIQCGSYVGNGSTTGPIINLGWRPQYLMIKNATATGVWQMIDASRGFTSANDAILLANTSGAETSANLANPDATGFHLASAASNVNTNGQTYIYMAIREAI